MSTQAVQTVEDIVNSADGKLSSIKDSTDCNLSDFTHTVIFTNLLQRLRQTFSLLLNIVIYNIYVLWKFDCTVLKLICFHYMSDSIAVFTAI